MNTIKLLIKLASFFPVQGYVRTANLQREPEACIVQELPLMHVKGDLNGGEKKVIRSRKELVWLFTAEELESLSQLKDIDFSKYSLLIGVDTYFSQVKEIQHRFVRTAKKTYAYIVEVAGGMIRPDTFMYGSIVKKLPKGAKVTFRMDEMNTL